MHFKTHRLFSTQSLWLMLLLATIILIWLLQQIYFRSEAFVGNPIQWRHLHQDTLYQYASRFTKTFVYFFTHEHPHLAYPAKDTYLMDNVTLVTAFFNIGSFQKASVGVYNASIYMEQAIKFSRVKNYVVLYSDDWDYIRTFESHRKEFVGRTKVVFVNKSKMWSFSLKNRVSKIFSNPRYPKFQPNTVNPSYSCAMIAKYEIVATAMEANYFQTSYFAWIDQGYFREFRVDGPKFTIGTPPGFDNRTVCFGEIFKQSNPGTVRNIFFTNNVWISAGFFLAEINTMKSFVDQFKRHVLQYIEKHLSSSDQQVLYAMYWQDAQMHSGTSHLPPLQVYLTNLEPGDCWFFLGKLCILEDFYVKIQ